MIQYTEKIVTKLTRLLRGDNTEQVACLIGEKDGEEYKIMDILPAQNEDYTPSEEFYISGRQMNTIVETARRRGWVVLGIAHSHMSHHPPYPSQADMQYCRHAINVVYHPSSQLLTWFNADGEIKRELAEPIRQTALTTLANAFA
jgi:proteasome lid subunit RPN8/RPN11